MGLDKQLAYNRQLADWRVNAPDSLKDSENAIDALGQLKKNGHINGITVINGLPRCATTVMMRALGATPEVKSLPVFHETLEDDAEKWGPKPLGSDILIGRLLESGITELEGEHLVLKIMSDQFNGDNFNALLEHTDHVVSMLVDPGRHIDKIIGKFAQLDEVTGEEIIEFMKRNWESFEENLEAVEKHAEQNPKQSLQHIVLNGVNLIGAAEFHLRKICDTTQDSHSPLTYDQKMLKGPWETEIFTHFHDTWSGLERQHRHGFNFVACPPQQIEPYALSGRIHEAVTGPIHDRILRKYPEAAVMSDDVLAHLKSRPTVTKNTFLLDVGDPSLVYPS